MRFDNFINGSYVSSNPGLATQDCINLYVEQAPGGDKSNLVMRQIPGSEVMFPLDNWVGYIRGKHLTAQGRLFYVKGIYLLELFSDFSVLERATLPVGNSIVRIADNGEASTGAGNQMMLVDGTDGFIYNLSANTLTQITDPDFPHASWVVYQDSYFIVNEVNTSLLHISDFYDGLVWPGFKAGVDGAPDTVSAIVSTNLNIWAFGNLSLQIYQDQGNAGFPYAPIGQTFQNIGLIATKSLSKINDIIFFLGGNNQGILKVYMGVGTDIRPVSDIFIEQQLLSYVGVDQSIGWSYQDNGHVFYVINFLQANKTWVYDVTTNQWHQRQTGDNRWKYDGMVYAFGYNLVNDNVSGKVYRLNNSVYTDDGEAIIRQRTSPHMFGGDNHWVIYNRFELEAKVGVGLSGSGLGSNPKVMFQISNDGGFTWSHWLIINYGNIGEYTKKLQWNCLGRARSMVFRIRITDPIEVFLMGAWVDAKECSN